MRTRRQRSSDIKIIVSATLAVLAAGALIAVGLLVASGNDDGSTDGRFAYGSLDDIRDDLDDGAPFYRAGGAREGLFFALDEGDIVAYPVRQSGDCSLDYDDGRFECSDEPVDPAELEQYPVTVEDVEGVPTVVVDLTYTIPARR